MEFRSTANSETAATGSSKFISLGSTDGAEAKGEGANDRGGSKMGTAWSYRVGGEFSAALGSDTSQGDIRTAWINAPTSNRLPGSCPVSSHSRARHS
jgi:hypothetical protein